MNNQSVFGRLSTSDLAAVHWNYAHFCWLANLFNIQDEAEALDWLIFWNLVKLKGVCAKTVNNSSKQVCTSHQITQNKLSALNRRFWFEDWFWYLIVGNSSILLHQRSKLQKSLISPIFNIKSTIDGNLVIRKSCCTFTGTQTLWNNWVFIHKFPQIEIRRFIALWKGMKYTIGFLSVSKLVICNIEMLHEKYDIFCLASSRPKVLLALPGQKCFAYTLQYIFRLVYQNIFFPFYFKVTSTANITIAYFILPNSLPLFKIPSKCYELFTHQFHEFLEKI